jgi:hypothetical protein
MVDQPYTRPLPVHRTTDTEKKNADIHASRGIRTHGPSTREGVDSSWLDRAALSSAVAVYSQILRY